MKSVKEAAANVGACARAGMEKTKATMEEKAEKMRSKDPVEKDMARERKHERLEEAEMRKQEAYDQNEAATRAGGHGYTCVGTGGYGEGDAGVYTYTVTAPGYYTTTTGAGQIGNYRAGSREHPSGDYQTGSWGGPHRAGVSARDTRTDGDAARVFGIGGTADTHPRE